MAASVRIEGEAFSDIRYEVLANACQLADADHARGKMLKLWQQCTAQHLHVLPRSIIVAVLGVNGPSGIVESGLGDEHHDGIRIKGTEGRIEWLAKLRENAAKGGFAKAAKRLPDGSQLATQMATQTPANTLPPPCPPTPTPTPTPIPIPIHAPSVHREAPSAPTAARPKQRAKPKCRLPADWEPDTDSAVLAAQIGVNCVSEAVKFRDHFAASGKTGIDWQAAFRNWLRRAAEWGQNRGGAQGGVSVAHQELARLTREARARGEIVDDTDLWGQTV